ncbi:hypothetical protein ANN_03926 [Periplaneta americana]|uniref:PiggyBac transposable element-derived protein domain-containing protein n=1 Tax=Periplaneta americana TaxID=6978 RepID=A0ABQ8T905_PERAM|nr:hypothetical protein ANN_03926 [Periplaneta americana]
MPCHLKRLDLMFLIMSSEEYNACSSEGNLSGQHMPGIKVEFVDDSHRVTSEIKVEEGRVPFDFSLVKCEGFPVLKCEAKEDSFDVERVQQEQKVKVSSEEDGVLIESILDDGEKNVSQECAAIYLQEYKLTQCGSNRSDSSKISDCVSETEDEFHQIEDMGCDYDNGDIDDDAEPNFTICTSSDSETDRNISDNNDSANVRIMKYVTRTGRVYVPNPPRPVAANIIHGKPELPQTEGTTPESRGLREVVKRLVTPIKDSGRNVTTDRFYTSVELPEDLYECKMTLVGTMKNNRKHIPEELKP